jgi:hypothetical protein
MVQIISITSVVIKFSLDVLMSKQINLDVNFIGQKAEL